MKYKMIAADFDGTLLTSDKRITEKTKSILSECRNNSCVIVGVTARNISSVKNVLDVQMFDYIVLNNGSDIYYVKEDRVESVSSIDKDIAKKIYDACEGISPEIDFCTPYNYLLKTNIKSDPRPFVKYINGIDEVTDSISRINVFFHDESELERNRSLIENSFDTVNVVKMLDTDQKNSRIWLTVNPKNVNKLNTLLKVCDEVKCSIDEVIFFGDGENDLLLLENVGMGVAMGNAINEVKEKSKAVTLTNDEDGIFDYLTRVRL